MMQWLEKFENTKVFTPKEAWKIYRIIAFSEAIGWSVLITGILLSYFKIVSSKVALPIAGQIHGTIFIAYFLILIFVYPSLKWSRTLFLLGIIAGIPPYGSLVFEHWVNKHQLGAVKSANRIKLLINDGSKLLVVQPSHGIDWQLPSFDLPANSTPTREINQMLLSLFNIKPAELKIQHYKDKQEEGITTQYYKVINPKKIFATDFSSINGQVYFIDEFSTIHKKIQPELYLKLKEI